MVGLSIPWSIAEIDKKEIFSIPRGTDLEYFNPENISQSIVDNKKESLNISNEDIVLSVPSRFTKWKGHKQILSFLSLQSPSILKQLKLILDFVLFLFEYPCLEIIFYISPILLVLFLSPMLDEMVFPV